MATKKVKNDWKRPIRIGHVVIPRGQVRDIEESQLLNPRVQRLKKSEKLVWPWKEKKDEPEPEAPAEPVKPPDDLTVLTHIGTGRSRKLEDAGIIYFSQLAKMQPGDLDGLLDLSEEQSEAVIEEAKAKVK